jgi:hypothetical protein
LYDYAHYNETLLGNTSIVFTRVAVSKERAQHVLQKFQSRFQVVDVSAEKIDNLAVQYGIDVVYVIKSGEKDEWTCTTRKCVIHCVFNSTQPHGHIYAAISDDLNRRHGTSVPVVPHIVSIPSHTFDLRDALHIPRSAIVIGRHGSLNTFDLPFVHATVAQILQERQDVYFLGLQTRQFCSHPRAIFLPATCDEVVKRAFLNTMDVMLHARHQGETFGLACAEASLAKKAVLTWAHSKERAHYEILGKACMQYDEKNLYSILKNDLWKSVDVTKSNVHHYAPSSVMQLFQDVFLS